MNNNSLIEGKAKTFFFLISKPGRRQDNKNRSRGPRKLGTLGTLIPRLLYGFSSILGSCLEERIYYQLNN